MQPHKMIFCGVVDFDGKIHLFVIALPKNFVCLHKTRLETKSPRVRANSNRDWDNRDRDSKNCVLFLSAFVRQHHSRPTYSVHSISLQPQHLPWHQHSMARPRWIHSRSRIYVSSHLSFNKLGWSWWFITAECRALVMAFPTWLRSLSCPLKFSS